MTDLDDLPVVTAHANDYLNHRQFLDYRAEREACLTWLLTFGKEPKRANGYAQGTVRPRAYRMDKFYRFVWERHKSTQTIMKYDQVPLEDRQDAIDKMG